MKCSVQTALCDIYKPHNLLQWSVCTVTFLPPPLMLSEAYEEVGQVMKDFLGSSLSLANKLLGNDRESPPSTKCSLASFQPFFSLRPDDICLPGPSFVNISKLILRDCVATEILGGGRALRTGQVQRGMEGVRGV